MTNPRAILTHMGALTAHPLAFLIAIAFTIFWFFYEPHSLDLHGIVTIATLFMTLFIQRASHRDMQALHAKIDALVKADDGASNDLADIDQLEPEEVEKRRGAHGPPTERG